MADREQEQERSIVAGQKREDFTEFRRRSLTLTWRTSIDNDKEAVERVKSQWERRCRYLAEDDCVVKELFTRFHIVPGFIDGARPEILTACTEFISSLKKALEKNKSISHLKLGFPSHGLEDCLSQLFMDLTDNKSVRRLFFGHPLSGQSIRGLATLLESTLTLTDLIITLENEDQVVPFSQGLKRNSSLKMINIALDRGITSQHLVHIASVLEVNSTVEYFNFWSNGRSTLDVTSLLRGLMASKSVQTFDISDPLFIYMPEIVRDVLKLNKVLKVLRLRIHSQTGLAALAEGLKSNGALEELKISFAPKLNTSFLHALRVVLEALCKSKSMLKHLDVGANPRDLDQIASLEDISSVQTLLLECSALESIAIDGSCLPADVPLWEGLLDALAPALCNESCSVRSLGLKGQLGRNDCVTIASILATKPRALTTLSLDGSEIDQEDFDAIMKAERSTSCLEQLHLHVVRASSPMELLKTLTDHECLKKLNLFDNNEMIGDSGAIALAKVLTSGNDCLETLCLESCAIKDAGVTAIGQMLPYNTTLKHIQLDQNEFGKSAAEALVRGLEKNTSVEELTGIPDEFYDEQEQAAHYTALNKADRKAYLEEDTMTDDDWAKAVGRFDDCGGLSAIYFAVRAKPHFICRRPDEKMKGTGKRKRDEDY